MFAALPVPIAPNFAPSPSSSAASTPNPGTPEELDMRLTYAVRRALRTVVMRAGTSKGLFLRLDDLPTDRAQWSNILCQVMGSPDPNGRQLDGLGGGTSTTSKIAVVSKSSDPRADVDYLFVQMPINTPKLDFSGNCGNISSGVGPFSVEEGLVSRPKNGLQQVMVRIRNVNTDRIIHSTFTCLNGTPLEIGDLALDGVSSKGSSIRLDFIEPAGAMTGRLLPTGSALDEVRIASTDPSVPAKTYHVSCVDAANPFVFVLRDELGLTGEETIDEITESSTATLMEIRATMAVRMGLASSVTEAKKVQGTPKIAIVGAPCSYTTTSNRQIRSNEADIWVRPYSMGKPHPTVPMTGAVCLGAASAIPGTLVNMIVQENRRGGSQLAAPVVIGHAGGTISTDGSVSVDASGDVHVERGSVYRTARKLMEGRALYMDRSVAEIKDVY